MLLQIMRLTVLTVTMMAIMTRKSGTMMRSVREFLYSRVIESNSHLSGFIRDPLDEEMQMLPNAMELNEYFSLDGFSLLKFVVILFIFLVCFESLDSSSSD